MGTAHAGRPRGENERAAGAISTAGSDLSGHGRVRRDRGVRDDAADPARVCPASGTEPPRTFHLTVREREAFRHLALGLTYDEAAVVMGVRHTTIRGYVWKAFARIRGSGFEIANTIDVFRLLGWLQVPAR